VVGSCGSSTGSGEEGTPFPTTTSSCPAPPFVVSLPLPLCFFFFFFFFEDDRSFFFPDDDDALSFCGFDDEPPLFRDPLSSFSSFVTTTTGVGPSFPVLLPSPPLSKVPNPICCRITLPLKSLSTSDPSPKYPLLPTTVGSVALPSRSNPPPPPLIP